MRSWYSYPYGSFNDTTIELMQYFGIDFAVTTNWGNAHINQGRFSLQRWDTNDWWNKTEKRPKSPIQI